jgi:starch-binding outer membrane protein, SusD/RagB family
MKKLIYIAIGLYVIVQTFSSCSKSFLDETLYSSYAPETLTDSSGFESAVVGLIYDMTVFEGYTSHQGFPCVWQVGTDIAYSTPNKEGIEIPYYDFSQLISTDNAAYYTWETMYNLINNANNIIVNIESSSVTGISDSKKHYLDAEARFFRAYAYDQLAVFFGGVPLVTTPVTSAKTDYVRSPLDSINALIEKDLVYASTNLPDIDKTVQQSRPNKAMAQQLLAEAYLRMDKPAKAEAYCDSIINSGLFSLVSSRYGTNTSLPGDYYHDMFIYGNQRRSQGNTEAIWVMEQENPSTVTGGTNGYPQQRRCWGAAYYKKSGLAICDSLGGRAIARMRLNNWVLYRLYEKGDVRNSCYNIRRKYIYNDATSSLYGQEVPYTGTDTIYIICPHTTKWYQYNPDDVFGYGMIKDFIFMRLGETYLLKAEAQYKQNNLAGAATTLTTLRARSNASAVSSSQISMDFILDERVRELVGEENRRYTLMRTGMLKKRALRLNNDSGINYPISGMDSTTTDKNLLPIPQSEIDLNKDAVLEQNPGY